MSVIQNHQTTEHVTLTLLSYAYGKIQIYITYIIIMVYLTFNEN